MHPYLPLKCDLFIKKLACFFKEKKTSEKFYTSYVQFLWRVPQSVFCLQLYCMYSLEECSAIALITWISALINQYSS